jgi:uncharacterized membrane protein YccC
MADFGGRRRPRALAYAAATVGGAALVTLGTAVSPVAWVAAVSMLVVGFVLSFAGVFGGYLAAAQPALLLAFVLAASIPATTSAIPARVSGWALAGAVSTLTGVFLWPWFEHVSLRRRAAQACLAVAEMVAAATPHGTAVPAAAAHDAVSAVRREYSRTKMRPAGPTRHDRAFVELVTQLEQIIELSERPFHPRPQSFRPCTDEGRRLAETVIDALRGSASVLTGSPPPDIRSVDEARRAHRTALDNWAAQQLRDGRTPEQVLEGIDVDHTLRVVAYLTIALSTNAVIAAGGRPDDSFPLPAAIPRLEGASGVVRRAARTVRAHLQRSSTVLHGSIRVGVGLALSVLLARTIGLSHAFWVVLGTLSVLRSNALGTGRTTIQALAGSIVGFVAGGLLAGVAGTNTAPLWVALPAALFLASYAQSAIGFMAGQAAFTLTVIMIFNLISPAGWQVGLVRIEDVAVGTGISVAVGMLLWPRGARRDVARATAAFYRAVVVYLDRAFDLVLGVRGTADVSRVRRQAVEARDRAGEAFDVFLNERGAPSLDPQTAGRLVAAELGYRGDACPDGAALVHDEVHTLLAGMNRLATGLAGGGGWWRPAPRTVRGRGARRGCRLHAQRGERRAGDAWRHGGGDRRRVGAEPGPHGGRPGAAGRGGGPGRPDTVVAVGGCPSALGGEGFRGLEPVGDETVVRLEREVGAPGHDLQERGEVLVAEALSDEANHDLVGQGGHRQRHVQLAGGLEAELEVLAQEVAGERRRVVEVDVRRRLVAAECRAHHAVVDEGQVVGAGDTAALGEDGGLGKDLGNHTEDQVVADLHQPGGLPLTDVRHTATEHPQVGEGPFERRARPGHRDRQPAGAGRLRVAADWGGEQRDASRRRTLTNRHRHIHRDSGGVDHQAGRAARVGEQTLRAGHHLLEVLGSSHHGDHDVAVGEVDRPRDHTSAKVAQRLRLGARSVVHAEVAAAFQQPPRQHRPHSAHSDPAEGLAIRRSGGHL